MDGIIPKTILVQGLCPERITRFPNGFVLDNKPAMIMIVYYLLRFDN